MSLEIKELETQIEELQETIGTYQQEALDAAEEIRNLKVENRELKKRCTLSSEAKKMDWSQ